jgi:hypothetical protein
MTDLGLRMDRAVVVGTKWTKYEDGFYADVRGLECRVTGGGGSWWTAYVGEGFDGSIGAYPTAAEAKKAIIDLALEGME